MPSDKTVMVTATVSITYKVHRWMDRHNPKLHTIKGQYLHLTAAGSDMLNKMLPAELEAKAAVIIADVASWERR